MYTARVAKFVLGFIFSKLGLERQVGCFNLVIIQNIPIEHSRLKVQVLYGLRIKEKKKLSCIVLILYSPPTH